MVGPKYQIMPDTKKKRNDRPMTDAPINEMKSIKLLRQKTPEAMVKILYGIGVKAAIKTARRPC